MTNAWHHRTDSISSLLTMIAIGVAVWGGPNWYFLDTLLAVLLGVYMAVMGLRLSVSGINDILDRAPENSVLSDLREHILQTPDVLGYHNFRARRIGDMIEVDVHVQVDSHLTVLEGHHIAAKVRKNIMKMHPEVMDVLVHIEPATDEHLRSDKGLGEVKPQN